MTKLTKLEAVPAPAPQGDAGVVLSMIDRLIQAPDVPVERLEQMFELHRRVQADNARRAYYAAFARLQAALPAVARKGKAHNDKRYARFEDLIAAIREPLAQHGFSVSFRTQQPDGMLSITGVLAHELGHVEETTMKLPQDTSGGKNAVQAWGSSVSYGKRYVLVTLLGIATDDDDDGRAAGMGETISEKQYKELADLLKASGTQLEKFLAHYGIESLSDMPVKRFAEARGMLKRKMESAK